MLIGLDVRLHAYAPGGISRYARRLAMELPRQLNDERLLVVAHRRETDALDLPAPTRTYRAWTPPHHRLERWALGCELLPWRLDVLHSCDFIPPAWGAQHFVITVHDLTFLHYPQYLTADARRYYNDRITWAVSRADAIIADSHATKNDLATLLHVPQERVTVIHLAADERFRPLPAAQTLPALARHGLEAGYLLFVGTWEPRKNLPGLLSALALLHERGERRPLVIAGRPGWLYDEVFTRVQALKLERWVRFVERVPENDLVALINGALLLTMPSFYEGFGLPALEAMQCGVPVVVSDRASLPEVVGQAGICVSPDDPQALAEAFFRVARDEGLRERMRSAGFTQARRFTWSKTAAQTLAVYRRFSPR